MAKQLNVNLAFTADTGKAKAQLQDLQNQLNKITTNTKSPGFGLTQDLVDAKMKVVELEAVLENCKTTAGGIDLKKLSQSLPTNGLKDYAEALSSLGPEGEQAFAKLARSISTAEIPLKKTNGLLSEFATTLKNTARWQISSSILHGFMGSVQSAYGYAKNLNESLNNIRIVTGYSTDQMAEFAVQANKAAKALSATTTDYTNASLIYYQQGLSDAEVQQRTDITIKMANVARQSAEVVSDQMTAVWNNFYDGSKSLEYYADVMTALGAATASSTDEIAGGLEKFAAIGETIGLSYEYAASALATITSNTRQSEEVVGTALKTIFARIQGLNLGETLEDGTSLNKYSEALEKVGISIFDQQGELKKMDNILDEMASKWETLDKAQQTALAQTVAGVRQYTQLVALMENWNNGDNDSMTANLTTARTSEGALNQQHEIYAEGWEAARDRVTAAAQAIYAKLLDDDFFIGLSNFFAKFLEAIDNTIDALGGLPGVLTTIGALGFKVFGKDMEQALNRWSYNLQLKSKDAVNQMIQTRKQANEELRSMFVNNANDGIVNQTKGNVYTDQANLQDTLLLKQQEMLSKGTELTKEEQKQAQLMLDITDSMGQQVINAAALVEKQEQNTNELISQAKIQIGTANKKKSEGTTQYKDFKAELNEVKSLQTEYGLLNNIYSKVSKSKNFGETVKSLQDLNNKIKEVNPNFMELDNILNQINGSDDLASLTNLIETSLLDLGMQAEEQFTKIRVSAEQAGVNMDKFNPILDKIQASFAETGSLTAEQIQLLKDFGVQVDAAGKKIQNMSGYGLQASKGIVALTQQLSSISSLIMNISGLIDIWNDKDKTIGEKLLSTFTSLTMILPLLTSSFNKNNLAQSANLVATVASSLGMKGLATSASTAAAGMTQATVSVGAFGTALWTTLWPIGLVVAAIAGLVIGIKALHDASIKEELAAEKAAETAEELATAYDEAKDKADALKSAFDGYDSVVEKLNSCTKGTQEWYQALEEVNNEVLTLLQEFPELARYENLFTRDKETGQLNIDESVRDQIIADAEKRVDSAQLATLAGNARLDSANLKVQEKQVGKSIGHSYGVGMSYSVEGGTYYDDYLDVGKILTDNALNLANLTEEEYRAEVRKLLIAESSETASKFANFDNQIDGIVNNCMTYQDQINTLALNTEETANKMLNIGQLISEATLGDNFSEAAKDVATNAMGSVQQQIYDDIIELDAKNQQAQTNTETSRKIWERFNKANNSNLIAVENQIQGNDNNRQYAYVGADGKTATYSIEYIASTIAAYEAINEKLPEIAEKATAAFNTMEESFKATFGTEDGLELGQGVKDYISSGNFESLNQSQVDDLKAQANGDTATFLKDVIFAGMTEEEIAQALGAESFDQAVSDWETGLNDITTALASAGDHLSKTPKALFNKLFSSSSEDLEKISVDEKENLATIYQEIFNEFGEKGLAAFDKMMQESGKNADEFAEILKDVDWNTTDINDLKDTLEAAGISTEGWDEGLGYLIDSMQKATEATITLADAQQEYASMQEIAKIQMGDTISQEQMDKLTGLNPAFQSFFQLMADGTYMLIEDAEYFKGVMDDMSFKGHYDLMDQYQTRLNNSEKLTGYNYDELNRRANNEFEAANQISYLEDAGYGDKALLEEAKISLQGGQHDSQEYLDELATAVGEVGDLTKLTTEELEEMESEIESIQDTISFSDYTDRISEVGLEFAATEEYAKSLEEELDAADGTIDGVAEGYNDITQAARDMAIANQRLDRGLSSLADNLDNYIKKLKDVNTNSTEYKEALSDLKTDIADIFNTSADMISDKFIEENLVGDPETLKQIADGNIDIINVMRQSVAEDILLNITTRMNTSELEQFPEWFATFQENFPDLETGVFLNPESEMEFVNALNNMIAAAGMTRDEVSNLLGSMGMSATLTTTYKEQEVEVPIYTTATKQTGEVKVPVTRVKGDGTTETLTETYPVTETMTTQTGVAKMMGYVPVTAIETEGADGTTSGGVIDILTNSQNSGAPKISPSASNVYNPATGEGGYTGKKNDKGGGKEKQPASKVDETKHKDVVDRYKEVDDAIDDVADALEDVNKLTDRMYGKSHINGLKEQNRLLQEEIGLLHQKVAEAKSYLAVDRQNLANAAAQAGVSLNIDSSGNISNYTSEMNRLYNELAAAEQAWNASYQSKTQEDQQAYQENVLDPLNEKIDGLKEAIAQYDETRELIEDLENELDDKFYEWQDNNYEILHYTLEIEIELNDLELQEIEYYLDKIADDFYSMAEGLAYMNKQIPLWSDTLGDYETFYNGLNDSFAKGEISQAAYVEGLKESYEGIFETLSALNELDDEMLHYYEDTLSAASDELATYTDHLEHLTSVLEHYKNIVELVNGEYDYDRIGTILEGQADTLNSELQVLKANYEMMLKEKQAIEQAYNNATAEEREVYEAELKAITAALDEAQEEMLSKTEEWAEAMKAIMENTIAAAGKELEDAFTGGIGFDSLANSLERLNSFNDEYLTKTNQIYETQKLMRQAQQASDRTDNQASKIKLKNFMNETQQLQEKNKLSNLDLEIQQARYELLLAELALEEAQNAKATVRLQRDDEGNFGYVYTADLEAVTEREQALADAENALYNIGLNAANDYGQRRLELQQQLADELIALNERRNNGEFATDALYYAERDRIMAEYTDLFIAYSDQYTTALGVDAEIQKDSWIQAYDKMIDQTANWKDHTEEYLSNCEDAYSNWRDLVANESEEINDVLNGVEDNVKDIVDESKNLSNTLVSQVIPAINQELIAVRNVTSAYASQRAQIMQLIVYYEQLCASIRAAIAAQAAMDNAVASNNSRYESGTVGGSGGGSGGRGNGGGSGGDGGASQLATDAQELVRKVHNGQIAYDSHGWRNGAKSAGYSSDAIQIALNAFNDSKAGAGYDYYYEEALKLAGQYDTGGYTGAFGSAGRLAILHEKELVLNKEDTENFLAATDILRGISKVIDLEAAQSTYAAARLVSGTIGEAKEVLEQIVKIEASFPAVSDRNEIEAAFNNLINTASQYANRKR